MKIALRGSGSRHLLRKLEKSGVTELVGGIRHELFFDSDWPNERLDEFLRIAARSGVIDLNPWMTFTRADLEDAKFFRLRPRKVVEDTAADYNRLRDHTNGLPWSGDDPYHRCRLPQRLWLSKIRLPPNQVAVVGQWTAEYVVPQAVRRIFEDAGLSGVEFRPITHTRTGASHDGFFHLYGGRFLGPRTADIATREIYSPDPAERGREALGCFCYDANALVGALDFNRTAEADVGFEFPEWVVSPRVRQLFEARLLKGWAFEPVLSTGSRRHRDYEALWASLYRLLADCGKHTIRGEEPPPAATDRA